MSDDYKHPDRECLFKTPRLGVNFNGSVKNPLGTRSDSEIQRHHQVFDKQTHSPFSRRSVLSVTAGLLLIYVQFDSSAACSGRKLTGASQ
jgi:hypothetical protein